METKKYPEFEKAGLPNFGKAWQLLIELPIKGRKLPNSRGFNEILDIDNNGVRRKSSTGKPSSITIDKFRFAYDELMKNGEVKRAYINEQVQGRCSSCVVSVLAELPYIEETANPRGLKLK